MPNDDTYEYRKKIGLPVTKKLVYVDMNNKRHEIKGYSIIKEYSIDEYWSILELDFADGYEEKIKIHSMYLKEMQNRKFRRGL